ncbi:unnamed protein product [Closterium sp. NIES-53]
MSESSETPRKESRYIPYCANRNKVSVAMSSLQHAVSSAAAAAAADADDAAATAAAAPAPHITSSSCLFHLMHPYLPPFHSSSPIPSPPLPLLPHSPCPLSLPLPRAGRATVQYPAGRLAVDELVVLLQPSSPGDAHPDQQSQQQQHAQQHPGDDSAARFSLQSIFSGGKPAPAGLPPPAGRNGSSDLDADLDDDCGGGGAGGGGGGGGSGGGGGQGQGGAAMRQLWTSNWLEESGVVVAVPSCSDRMAVGYGSTLVLLDGLVAADMG